MKLSPRRRETLDLLCKGLTYKEIAHIMGTCYKATSQNLMILRYRNNCRTNAELVAKYISFCIEEKLNPNRGNTYGEIHTHA